jgi:hypothetical protein
MHGPIDLASDLAKSGDICQERLPLLRRTTDFYTAKRMLHTLMLTVQRHEVAFGVLETDVQPRAGR